MLQGRAGPLLLPRVKPATLAVPYRPQIQKLNKKQWDLTSRFTTWPMELYEGTKDGNMQAGEK
jgi:hypothetical protein